MRPNQTYNCRQSLTSKLFYSKVYSSLNVIFYIYIYIYMHLFWNATIIAQKTNSVTCNFITENTSYMKISLFTITIHKDFQQLLRILVNVKHKHWHYPQSWLHDKISAFWVGLFGCFVVEFQAKFPSLKQIQNLLMSMGKTLSENTWNYYIVPHSQDPYHIITLYRVWSFGNKVWNKQNYTSADVWV